MNFDFWTLKIELVSISMENSRIPIVYLRSPIFAIGFTNVCDALGGPVDTVVGSWKLGKPPGEFVGKKSRLFQPAFIFTFWSFLFMSHEKPTVFSVMEFSTSLHSVFLSSIKQTLP